MTLSLLTLPDHQGIDLLRGIAAFVGAGLLLACAVCAVLVKRRGPIVPAWVAWALIGWALGDVYVAAREAFEIGRPWFVLGLPLALAWELCALMYLRRLWHATGGLRHRPDW